MDDLISRKAAIDTEGLEEEIRCEMCKNPMHTDRGCDGNCKYDEKLYEKIIQILDKRITPLTSAQPKIGRWIENEKQNHVEKMYHCSECGFNAWGLYEKTKFCGGCGARMEDAYEG